MTFWDLVWSVILLSLTLLVVWTWVDLIRDRDHPCCCGLYRLPRDLTVHDARHTVHTRAMCQPCREVI